MADKPINTEEFKRRVADNRLEPVYVAVGGEALLLDEVAETACSIADETTRDFNLDILHGDDLEAGSFASALNSLPMMAERRVVVVKRAESISSPVHSYLLEYVRRPSPETVLVLLLNSSGKKSWEKKVIGEAVVIDCETPRKRKLEEWLAAYAASKGIKLTPDAVALMTEGREVRLIDLAGEIEKASLLLDDEQDTLDLETLQQIWGIRREINIWRFFDRVASGRRLEALRDFLLLRQDYERDQAGFILSQVIRRLRLAWKENTYNRMRVPQQKRAWSGNTEIQWRMASQALKSLPPATAQRALFMMREADRERKTRTVHPGEQFERIVHKIALERKRAGNE